MEKRELAYIGVIGFLLILLGVFMGLWKSNDYKNAQLVNSVVQEVKKYSQNQPPVKVVRNSLDSSIIASQSQVILKQAAASRLELTKIRTSLGELKKVSERINVNTGYLVKNVEKPYDSTATLKQLADGTYLKLPHTLSFADLPHYSLKITQTPKGQRLDSLQLWDNSEIIIGLKKRGFFRRSEPSIMFRNRNKYLSAFDMKNIKVEYRKPFYETRLFNMALGALTLYGAQQGLNYLKP